MEFDSIALAKKILDFTFERSVPSEKYRLTWNLLSVMYAETTDDCPIICVESELTYSKDSENPYILIKVDIEKGFGDYEESFIKLHVEVTKSKMVPLYFTNEDEIYIDFRES